MSLINNLLKDLEKRQHSEHVPHLIALTLPDEDEHPLILNLLIVSLLLLITSYLAYNLWIAEKHYPKTQILLPYHSFAPSNFVAASEPTSISEVTGITFEVKDNMTELGFYLNHPALFKINEVSNNISIAFDNAKLNAEVPNFSTFQTAIARILPNISKDGLEFNLQLAPETTLKYLNVDDKSSQIVFGFETKNAPKLFTQPAVKMPAMHSLLLQEYDTAIKLADKGYYQDAVAKLKNILLADETFKDARVSLVALYIDQHNLPAAETLLAYGLMNDPDYVPYLELKARVLVTEGNDQAALAILQSAAPDKETNQEYYGFLALLYERTNNDLSALKLYKELLSINPYISKWWFGLALSYDKLGEKQAAIDAYTKAYQEGHLSSESTLFLNKRLAILQGKVYASE